MRVLALFVLAITLPIPGIATFQVSHVVQRSLRLQHEVREAQFLSSRALRLAIDQETGVRGYARTGNALFLQPYHAAIPAFLALRPRLEGDLRDAALPFALQLFERIVAADAQWQATVAEPLIRAGTSRPNERFELRGKVLMDDIRTDAASMQEIIAAKAEQLDAETARALQQTLVLGLLAALTIVALALLVGVVQQRLWDVIDRRRLVADSLQRAFGHEAHRLPDTSVGTAYVSATPDSAFGGDLFDIRCLDAHRAYVLVGDVSGKGVQAVADATFVKHGVEALARECGDAGDVLSRFNAIYAERETKPEAFVVAFLGVIDYRTGTLSYASAAHSAAYLRRAGGPTIEQLRLTGPLIGVFPEERFGTETLLLHQGDALVIATDGLTEARDGRGEMLTDDGVMQWLATSNASDPQTLVDGLVRRRSLFSGARSGDDVAIVALRFDRLRTADPACLPADSAAFVSA